MLQIGFNNLSYSTQEESGVVEVTVRILTGVVLNDDFVVTLQTMESNIETAARGMDLIAGKYRRSGFKYVI